MLLQEGVYHDVFKDIFTIPYQDKSNNKSKLCISDQTYRHIMHQKTLQVIMESSSLHTLITQQE